MRKTGVLGALGWILFLAVGCSSDPADSGTPQPTGGSTSSGGVNAAGGSKATGGGISTGGQATGGATSTSGGSVSNAGTGGSSGRPNQTGGASTAGSGGSPAGGSGGGGGNTSGVGGNTSGVGGNTSGAGGSKAGSSGTSGTAGQASGGSGGGGTATEKFSFFVTSREGLVRLSGSMDGFGGDLRHGEPTGLEGADKICRELAEASMPGAGQKVWRAFLSTTTVDAVERIGEGPWYDRLGRLIANNKEDLLQERPRGAAATIANDLPNEDGSPNRSADDPGCAGNECPDNHDTLTGSKADGTWDGESTCDDWTNTMATGAPRIGHSWPAGSGMGWIQAHAAGGCKAGINLVQGGGTGSRDTVGALGGYGGFYCLALTP
jgi:hypothetical protein